MREADIDVRLLDYYLWSTTSKDGSQETLDTRASENYADTQNEAVEHPASEHLGNGL